MDQRNAHQQQGLWKQGEETHPEVEWWTWSSSVMFTLKTFMLPCIYVIQGDTWQNTNSGWFWIAATCQLFFSLQLQAWFEPSSKAPPKSLDSSSRGIVISLNFILFSQKTWTQTCRPAWGRARRSLCPPPLCPAQWRRHLCHPGETPLAASPASSWVSSVCPELCRSVPLFFPCL